MAKKIHGHSRIANITETEQVFSFTLKQQSTRYLDEFLSLKCCPDMVLGELFPNTKEISESFGMFHAVRKHLQRDFPLDDPNVYCVVVGDGSTPELPLHSPTVPSGSVFLLTPP